MELFRTNGAIEQLLVIKAQQNKSPVGGTFELSPVCNMNCRMCYVRQEYAQVQKAGGLLTVQEWLDIASQLKEKGTLFLLLTGGEPLLYPGFKELYCRLQEMGFILEVNTNGTLIDEEWADFFATNQPRQLNITMYGYGEKSYASLCRYGSGFQKVTKAYELLLERKVPFRITCSLTPLNIADFPQILQYARDRKVTFSPTEYMFPPFRVDGKDFIRFTPEECADVKIRTRLAMYPATTITEQAEQFFRNIEFCKPLPPELRGISCRAGSCGFWINWKGELMTCGMIPGYLYDLKHMSVEDAWKQLVEEARPLRICPDCASCKKRNVCDQCIASCAAETGSITGKPEYLCRMIDAMMEILYPHLSEESQEKYRGLMEEVRKK